MRRFPSGVLAALILVGAVLVATPSLCGASGKPASTGKRAATTGKKYAIVVGIDQYQRKDINSLGCAVGDAHLLSQTLRGLGFDKVCEMTSEAPRDSDNYPTANNIQFQLGNVRRLMEQAGSAADSFVFYFSGHGLELKDPATGAGETYLLTVDTDIRNDDVLKKSAYRFGEVKDVIGRMPVRNVLVVFDACRNDPRGGGRATGDNRLSRTQARDLQLTPRPVGSGRAQVVATLFACAPGQRSYEWSDRGHGYFTWFLVQGLQGKAASGAGKVVTLQNLADYTARQVRSVTEDAGYTQDPWLRIDGPAGMKWVLAAGGKAGAGAEGFTAPRPPAVGSDPHGASGTEAGTSARPGAEKPTDAKPTGPKPAEQDASLAYVPYLRGGFTLGFTPDAALCQQVLGLVKTSHVEVLSDQSLYNAAAREVAVVIQATGADASGIASLPRDAALPQAVVASYGGQINPDLLYYALIRGMLKSTGDPYTVLMTPGEYRRVKDSMDDKAFGGIGISIGLDCDQGDQLTVVEPLEGGPAAAAGLLSGDQILRIDGKPTRGLPLDTVTQWVRGPVGSVVTLNIKRPGTTEIKDYPLTRQQIEIKSLSWKMLPDGIGYVRLRAFGAQAGQEMTAALAALEGAGAHSLILDVRNNGGGYLTAATDTCSHFVEHGSLVTYTVDRAGKRVDFTTSAQTRTALPMVLLVNHFTQSASEITTGCLHDYARAHVIGTRTFGKGSAQRIYPLPSGAALEMTTEHFFTPKGAQINKLGLEPDETVEMEANRVGRGDKDVQLQRAVEYLKAHP